MSATSAQFEVLRPFVTDRISALVRGRLLDGVKFFENNVLAPEFSRSEVKLALLLVQIANPNEPLTVNEVAILEGGQRRVKGARAIDDLQKGSISLTPKKPKKRG